MGLAGAAGMVPWSAWPIDYATDGGIRTRIAAMSHNEPGGCRYDRGLASAKLAAMNEDDICRVALADADMTRRFLRLLPARATAELDPRRLRRLPTELVAPGGQRRRADMAWAVGLLAPADAKAEALLALEFQSSPDSTMALRMEAYVALLRQETIAEGGSRADGLLPRALPVAVYTGRRRWRPETLGELTAPTPAGWSRWQARFEFILLDAATLTAEDGRSNPVAALLRLLASRRAEALPSLAKTLFDGLRPAVRDGSARERRAFADRLARALMRLLIARFAGVEESDEHRLRQALRYMEEPVMLAEAITEWRQEAIAEGVREGTSEGRRTLLRRLATRRYGVEAGDEFGRLLAQEEDADRLELAGDLVIDCSSAEELLRRGRRLLGGDGAP